MKVKHSPAPFHAENRFIDGDNGVLAADGFTVADVPTHQSRRARNGRIVRREISVEEQMANVALLSAAPALADRVAARMETCRNISGCGSPSGNGECSACASDREVLRAAGRLP